MAASTQTQALSALLFLYEAVLGEPLDVMAGLKRVRKPPRIPTVLSRREVRALLAQMQGTNGLVAGLLYGAGLRVSGALLLRVKDIDLDRRQLNIHRGKSDKDRVALLPDQLLIELARQLEVVRALHLQDLAATSDTGHGLVAVSGDSRRRR